MAHVQTAPRLTVGVTAIAIALAFLLSSCDPSSPLLVRNSTTDNLTLRLEYSDGQTRSLALPAHVTGWALSPVEVATRPDRVSLLNETCGVVWTEPFGEAGMLVIDKSANAAFVTVPSDAPPASETLANATRCTG